MSCWWIWNDSTTSFPNTSSLTDCRWGHLSKIWCTVSKCWQCSHWDGWSPAQIKLCVKNIWQDNLVLFWSSTGWSVQNGFKFSKTKTVCMHFFQLRGVHAEPELTCDGDPIKVIEETKFVGLIFDTKLSFTVHRT